MLGRARRSMEDDDDHDHDHEHEAEAEHDHDHDHKHEDGHNHDHDHKHEHNTSAEHSKKAKTMNMFGPARTLLKLSTLSESELVNIAKKTTPLLLTRAYRKLHFHFIKSCQISATS